MSATMTNGKPRKQLSDQLDRLDEQLARQDSIIDALAEGLNQAVADAAKEGVKTAVKDAVIELMTNLDLRAALHKATAPPAEARPSAWDRLKAKVRQAATKTKQVLQTAAVGVAARVTAARAAVTGTAAGVGLAWRLRKVMAVGLTVGLTVAAVSYVTTHGVAAVLSGLGATVTAVAVQAGLLVRKAVHRLASA
jgi:hypothetical protein